jgi:hypothetical protein
MPALRREKEDIAQDGGRAMQPFSVSVPEGQVALALQGFEVSKSVLPRPAHRQTQPRRRLPLVEAKLHDLPAWHFLAAVPLAHKRVVQSGNGLDGSVHALGLLWVNLSPLVPAGAPAAMMRNLGSEFRQVAEEVRSEHASGSQGYLPPSRTIDARQCCAPDANSARKRVSTAIRKPQRRGHRLQVGDVIAELHSRSAAKAACFALKLKLQRTAYAEEFIRQRGFDALVSVITAAKASPLH